MLNFQCECKSGYTGELCDTDIDECSVDVDVTSLARSTAYSICGHGRCRNLAGSFECICERGYRGKLCNLDVNECEEVENICDNNANCSNLNPGFRCNCAEGYSGLHCEVKPSKTSTTSPKVVIQADSSRSRDAKLNSDKSRTSTSSLPLVVGGAAGALALLVILIGTLVILKRKHVICASNAKNPASSAIKSKDVLRGDDEYTEVPQKEANESETV